ncbi:GUC2D-like protein [Mya arenaria]|uniref:GUC2D-like protein n=1 Tax=Mya arenaria TaxID=6604 RepID=A0ABY7E420_MYAAR|nr:GUC2D-like protein [Mya arenaria]
MVIVQEDLKREMVPKSIAKKLRSQGTYSNSDFFKCATIMFADIFGFNQISMELAPGEVIDLINTFYGVLDERIANYNVYKVEAINDSYMVASGIPNKDDNHVAEICTLALDLLHVMNQTSFSFNTSRSIHIRIGIHTGPCRAGVIGTVMLKYCLFGEAVFVASRMKLKGLQRSIQNEMSRHEFDTGNLGDSGRKKRESFEENMDKYKDVKRNSYQSVTSNESVAIEKAVPPSLLQMPINEWKEEEIFDKY